jgi:hypothetical protein
MVDFPLSDVLNVNTTPLYYMMKNRITHVCVNLQHAWLILFSLLLIIVYSITVLKYHLKTFRLRNYF